MGYNEIQVGKKWYDWYECDIIGCDRVASHQSASTGRLICKEHYGELALIPHQSGFVAIDGGKKPRQGKK